MSAPQNTLIAGQFVTAITQDRQGNMWFGSEEYGVVRFTKDGERTHFTSKHGLGDDNGYALVADADNNIWVGTLNHGLSKYDGKTWTTYSLLDGLGGLRVYCLAASPDGKTIWCGQENGITRFDGKTWRWFSLADGLPWREIAAVAVGKDGTVWVGGAMGGLGYFDGKAWTRVGKDAGLPDERINGLCLARDGRLWVATCRGAACYDPQEQAFHALSPPDASFFGVDSYVTCVAQDQAGCIWFGSRRGGLAKYDLKAGLWQPFNGEQHNLSDNYVSCLQVLHDGHLWCGNYGYGLYSSIRERTTITKETRAPTGTPRSPLTSGNIDWDADVLQARLRKIKESGVKPAPNGPDAQYMGEDWQTQGNWMGNYGKYFRCLAAMGYPLNYEGGRGAQKLSYLVLLGENRDATAGLAGWVHWGHTRQLKCLQNPIEEDRRQADWDDRGELYPAEHEGPDLFINLDLREEGLFRLALYFVNKDSHELKWRAFDKKPGANRFRDYVITISGWKPTEKDLGPETWGLADGKEKGWAPPREDSGNEPEFARSRIYDFTGGMYKRFLMKGPGRYRIHISREHSHNAICSGFFLDKLDALPRLLAIPEDDPATDRAPIRLTPSPGALPQVGFPGVPRKPAPSKYYVMKAKLLLDDVVRNMGTCPEFAAASADQMRWLCHRLYDAERGLKGWPCIEANRALVVLLHHLNQPEDARALTTQYAMRWREYVLKSVPPADAVRAYRNAAAEVWSLDGVPEVYMRWRRRWPAETLGTSIWRHFVNMIALDLPKSEAPGILESTVLAGAIVDSASTARARLLALEVLRERFKQYTIKPETRFAEAEALETLEDYSASLAAYETTATLCENEALRKLSYVNMGRVAVFYLRDIEAATRALTGLGMIDRRSRESQDLESSICILSLLLGDEERADALISGFFAGNPPEDLRARVRRAISEKKQNQGRVSPLSNE